MLAQVFNNPMPWMANWLGLPPWFGWPLWGGILVGLFGAILLLYFLKLKRQPVEVPSTYLWHRTIEDLHVNTIWQRLRQSLLLFLQLLLIALAMAALLRPGWKGQKLVGERLIFLVDASASMGATDVRPTRLELAKRRIGEMIDQMKSDQVAMLISFSDVARVEQSFTDNRRDLREALEAIQQTDRLSDLDEALRAASGLANPGRVAFENRDVQVAEAQPATLYIFSDGGVSAVPNFQLGNLTPVYVPIGTGLPDEDDSPQNVAIVAFSTERNPEKPDQTQAFARLQNFGQEDVTVEVAFHLNNEPIDFAQVKVPAEGTAGVEFERGELESAELKLVMNHKDHLALDNTAYVAVNNPRRAKVLVITPRNDALELVLNTTESRKVADVTFQTPDVLPPKESGAGLTETQQQYQTAALSGAYDLIVYDQCAPAVMPQANTLFIGRIPPGEDWKAGPKQPKPLVIDVDRTHPLMQLVVLDNVDIVEGFSVTGPSGSTTLIDAAIGPQTESAPVFMVGPRQGFEDAVMGFELFGTDAKGEYYVNTNWMTRLSFPLFMKNVIEYLGGSRGALETQSVRPGETVTLRTEMPVAKAYVRKPDGRSVELLREGQNAFTFSDADRLGFYDLRLKPGDEQPVQRFAVNLFDTRESNLTPAAELPIGSTPIKGSAAWTPARRELWKWVLLVALAVLLFEWYVYNKRVYL
jgi:hypothetical protein